MWPGESGARALNLNRHADAWHLSRDAEFAEELAIRYADTHRGLRSGHFESQEVYGDARNQCLGGMCEQIGKAHSVKPAQVFQSLGRNRAEIDLAVNLPFILLYGLAASVVVRRIWNRCPPEEGWGAGVAIIVLASLVFGLLGFLVGDEWSGIAESLRVGSGHLSYRGQRLPWARYRGAALGLTVVLFWVVAAIQARRPRQS